MRDIGDWPNTGTHLLQICRRIGCSDSCAWRTRYGKTQSAHGEVGENRELGPGVCVNRPRFGYLHGRAQSATATAEIRNERWLTIQLVLGLPGTHLKASGRRTYQV